MIIDTQNPNFLYNIFFSLAHIVSWVILIWYGQKHKYPKLQWLLIIVTGYICFTIGSHVLAVNPESFKMLFSGEGWPVSKGKSLISGLLFAVPVMLLVKYLFKFNHAIFEPYAIAIPLGIAIQRFGCIAAGCCYGKATDLPWGVSYNYGHSLHYKQWEQGILSSNELQSIPIHPVQIYEGILCLVIVALILYFYKRKWMKDQLIYTSLFLYLITRFITEFFREEAAHTIGLNSYFGLNTVQWIMIIFGLLLLYIFAKKRKTPSIRQRTYEGDKNISFKDYAWFILLFGLILTTPKFYSPLELLLLGLLFIPLLVLVFWQFFRPIKVLKLRLATTSIFVLAFFSMSQNSPVVQDSVTQKKYHKLSFGGLLGYNSMNNSYVTTSSTGGSCDGTEGPNTYTRTSVENQFNDKYYLIGGAYSYVNKYTNNKKLTAGLGVSYARINENITSIINITDDTGLDTTFTIYTIDRKNNYAFSPFLKMDFKLIGFGGGVTIGNFNLFNPSQNTILEQFNTLLQFHFRLGHLSTVWGEFNYNHRFPGTYPASEIEFLLGLSNKKGNSLRIGASSYHYLIIRPQFYIKGNLAIEPFVGIGGSLFKNESAYEFTNDKGFEGGINLHYWIPHKSRKSRID